jgi:hypothetical protein
MIDAASKIIRNEETENTWEQMACNIYGIRVKRAETAELSGR